MATYKCFRYSSLIMTVKAASASKAYAVVLEELKEDIKYYWPMVCKGPRGEKLTVNGNSSEWIAPRPKETRAKSARA